MPPQSSEGPWTILKALSWTESHFKSKSIDSPRLTAELLLAHCLKIRRLDLYLHYDRPLNADELTGFKKTILRRLDTEPVAYITGTRGFWESEFMVTPEVLIPRPDTETLVEAALEILAFKKAGRKNLRVIDLGTGSGAIIVSLAKAFPLNRYFATDKSGQALKVAKQNVLRNLEGTDVLFWAGSWFEPVKCRQGFDLIVSNPPYIPTGDIPLLQPEINRYEPWLALDGGSDGLDCIREIIGAAPGYLAPNGSLLIEIGAGQKEAVADIAEQARAYGPAEFHFDYAGHPRVVKLVKN